MLQRILWVPVDSEDFQEAVDLLENLLALLASVVFLLCILPFLT